MKLISPKLHGALDYAVASVLVCVPLVLGFSDDSVVAAVMAIAAGVGLFVYSLLTDYSAGLRAVIPFRVHLALDAIAAMALVAAPFLLGFAGIPRAFYVVIGGSVLAVVACTRVGEAAGRSNVLLPSASTSVS